MCLRTLKRLWDLGAPTKLGNESLRESLGQDAYAPEVREWLAGIGA
jgi:hypothetical protein